MSDYLRPRPDERAYYEEAEKSAAASTTVCQLMSQFREMLERLDNSIAKLEIKVAPICVGRGEHSDQKPSIQPVEHSELYSDIDWCLANLGLQINRLQDITSRIEL